MEDEVEDQFHIIKEQSMIDLFLGFDYTMPLIE